MAVLVVEDDYVLGKICLLNFKRLGQPGDLAGTAEEAVQLFRSNQYDLVILDIGLPRTSGLQIVNQLRSINDKVPIIAVTGGYSTPEDCAKRVFDGYYLKPLRENNIAEILAKHATL
jgi:DNA-binding response OmpR family regulator